MEMEDPFLGLKRNFPSKNVFGKLDEELLTDDIEDDEAYDAFNDETFGIGADDGDWEEDHDKFAELVKDKSSDSEQSSLFSSSLYDDVVSKSISQLGLEDDLDDPAIMTIGRSHNAWDVKKINRSSPPPPAIIDPELCGSPKAHSIWSANNTSTPVKESGIGSLFSSISNSANSYQHHMSPLSPSPGNVFTSPLTSKAWTVEELERDLTSSKTREWSGVSSSFPEQNSFFKPKPPSSSESVHKQNSIPNLQEKSTATKTVPGIRTLDDVETDILFKSQVHTVEELERSMQSKSTPSTDAKSAKWSSPAPHPTVANSGWTPYNNNVIRPGFPSPLARAQGMRHGSPFSPFRHPVISPEKANNFPGPYRPNFRPLNMYPPHMNPMPGPYGNQIPHRKQIFYPTSVLNSQNMKGLVFGPSRLVRHPLLGTAWPDYMWHYPPQGRHTFSNDGDYRRTSLPDNYDEYACLMTQAEKEWLLRIQVMLVQSANPYVDDFYYSTFLTRKCAQEALKKKPDKKDGPKLLLPERAKTETKAYVPAQFEGSLGKLQAVSVNFPRKVLDITVSRSLEDEDSHSASQNVTKNRCLLLGIERLYNSLLEIDDEEKRILALPEDAHAAYRENIEKLTEKLFVGLGCDCPTTSDTFHSIMAVRKGRNLGMRCFQLLSQKQKSCFLVALSRCLSHILRKDQNDLILLKNLDNVLDCIKTLNLSDIVAVGQSLENLPRTDTVIVPVKEKSNYISAFKNKFGSTVVCCLIERAESIYASNESVDSENQAKWAKVVLHIVDIICTLPDSSIVSPASSHNDLLIHFQRFAVDRDKFEVLKKKLNLFRNATNCDVSF